MPVKPKSTVRITHHRLFDTPIFSVTLEHFKVHKTKVSFNEDMISYIHGLQKEKKVEKNQMKVVGKVNFYLLNNLIFFLRKFMQYCNS